MHTLKIEHPIGDFETWKAAFDRDPVGRKASGVRRYRVFRPVEDQKYILIDLDFDEASRARAFLESLRQLWSRVELTPGLLREPGGPKPSPKARIVEQVESEEY